MKTVSGALKNLILVLCLILGVCGTQPAFALSPEYCWQAAQTYIQTSPMVEELRRAYFVGYSSPRYYVARNRLFNQAVGRLANSYYQNCLAIPE